MAVLSLDITIDDDDLPRLLAACRVVFGNPTMTEAQMSETIREYGMGQLQEIVHNYERKLAVEAAEGATYSIAVS
jgi:hypothetical protein